MRRFLLVLLMLTPLAAGGQGIEVGDEFFLLADGPGKGIQATPDAAFGDGAYLAVWREGWHGKGGKARVHAARVSAEGKVLDPQGIEVAPCKDGIQEHPRVAFAAGVFLVVWQDFRNGKDCDVLAARVSKEGKVLDAEPIAVAAAPRTQALPAVASDGKGFLVVWQGMVGEETAYRGFAAPVSADGKVGATVETGATPQPKLAWNGRNYLVACGGAGFWSGEVRGVLLGADGKPAGKPTAVLGGTKTAVFSLSAVPDKGWLVVSHRSPPDPWGWGGPGAMRAAFVNAEGKVENPVKEDYPKARLPNWLDMGKPPRRPHRPPRQPPRTYSTPPDTADCARPDTRHHSRYINNLRIDSLQTSPNLTIPPTYNRLRFAPESATTCRGQETSLRDREKWEDWENRPLSAPRARGACRRR